MSAIPKSVTTIEEDAFDGCDRLRYIHYAGSQKDWESIKIGEGNDELLSAKMKYRNTKDFLCPWCGDVHIDPLNDDKAYRRFELNLKNSFHRFFAALFGARFK